MRFDARQAQAVVTLLQNEDFKIYMGALGDYGETLMKNLVAAPPDTLPVKQGRVQTVTEIMKALDNAQQTVQDFQTRASKARK